MKQSIITFNETLVQAINDAIRCSREYKKTFYIFQNGSNYPVTSCDWVVRERTLDGQRMIATVHDGYIQLI